MASRLTCLIGHHGSSGEILRVGSRKSRLIVYPAPLRIQRIAVGVGIALALVSCLRIDRAHAQGRLEAHSTATVAGIQVGSGISVIEVRPHTYVADCSGRATGRLRA